MRVSHLTIDGRTIPKISCEVIVAGSGTASLNGALHCKRLGIEDVVIVTDRMGAGTSANTGSDKQTYYRLNPGGCSGDSIREMAFDLFSGQCMHGDIALVEAALSEREFFHLVELGVGFPHNKYGDYAGYITDHDERGRGTSAGPRTSIMMYEKLADEIRQLGIPVLEKYFIMDMIVDTPPGAEPACKGIIAIDKSRKDDAASGLVLLEAPYIIYGTGGPGALFRDSVYPHSQVGALGLALRGGARAQNLTENQFGIASTKVRWNLSGSFQQVLPRYISTSDDGSDEREFLNGYFPDAMTQLTAQFLKGYQWPFDVRKISGYGSSLIDLLVYYQQKVKGRRVFMDFRHNPSIENFTFTMQHLPPVVREYLENSGAHENTPVKRLRQMNEPAYRLYFEKGIDLAAEPLEIAVCHQHMNGGLVADHWWESNVKNFFPVGECCGTHGVYRPGGSALNSGQVGSLRAAQCIARRSKRQGEINSHRNDEELLHKGLRKRLKYLDGLYQAGGKVDPLREREALQSLMSENMGIFRDPEMIRNAVNTCKGMMEVHRFSGISGSNQLIMFLQNEDLLVTAMAFLVSASNLFEKITGGRGSWLVGSLDAWKEEMNHSFAKWLEDIRGDDSLGDSIQEIRTGTNLEFTCGMVNARAVPESEIWFEAVWKQFREDEHLNRED